MKKQYYQRAPRKQLYLYLDVLDQETHEKIGHVGDISLNGIMLITEQPVALDSIKAIRIQLPSELKEFSQEALNCIVDARWTKPDLNPKLHCIGCRFTKISDEDLPVIERLEDVLGFNN